MAVSVLSSPRSLTATVAMTSGALVQVPALRELGHLVDGVGVGLAHVLVGELGHGEGSGAVPRRW